MSYLVLARKWRPKNFDEVVGQESVVRTLKNAIKLDRVAHAYLLTGARGVGKTTIARVIAKALNCKSGPTPFPDDTCTSCMEISQGINPDVFEIDGASNTGVDDVRALRENSQYLPSRNRYKMYIIDEVHMLSVSAFNALLKTLEEPPAHVKFVFATTEPHKIPITVISRCQRFDLKRIPTQDIYSHLDKILKNEQIVIEEEGLRTIAREAAGSMRDALSLTDQVLAFGGEKITTEHVIESLGLTTSTLYQEVISSIIEQKPDQLMKLVEKLFNEGNDLKRFMEGLLWYVRNLILFRSIKDPSTLIDTLPEERLQLEQLAKKTHALHWHQIFDVCSRALYDLGNNPYPRMVVETTLLRLSVIEPLLEIDMLLERIDTITHSLDRSSTRQTGPNNPVVNTIANPEPSATTAHDIGFVKKNPEPKHIVDGVSEESPASTSWKGLVDLVAKHRPSLGSVLFHARPLEVNPKYIKISLEPNSFFADQMKSSRNIKDLKKFCKDYFKQPTEIELEESCISDADKPSLAESQEKTKAQLQQSIHEEVMSHPMVQEAIRIFNAEVDQIRSGERNQT